MKSVTPFLLILSFLLSTFSIHAQSSTKIDGALSGFLKTEFMMKFQDLKTEAEGLATAFKSEQNKYSVQDRTRVSTAYDKTARRFNAVLVDIKTDFLNKDKIKVISKFPDMYADGLRADMRDLSDYYAQNFQQALSDVTQDEVDGSAIVILLIELVKLSSEGIHGLVQMRKNAKKYDDTYLSQHLVRPNQFRYWEQLGSNNSNDSYNDNYNDTYDDINNQDTYDQDNYNQDTYDQNTNNEETYNEDTYNDNTVNDNTYNEDNYNNSNNNLNQNNSNNTRYDDIENFKFEKKVSNNTNTNRYKTTNKNKVSTPTNGTRKVIKPKVQSTKKYE